MDMKQCPSCATEANGTLCPNCGMVLEEQNELGIPEGDISLVKEMAEEQMDLPNEEHHNRKE